MWLIFLGRIKKYQCQEDVFCVFVLSWAANTAGQSCQGLSEAHTCSPLCWDEVFFGWMKNFLKLSLLTGLRLLMMGMEGGRKEGFSISMGQEGELCAWRLPKLDFQSFDDSYHQCWVLAKSYISPPHLSSSRFLAKKLCLPFRCPL